MISNLVSLIEKIAKGGWLNIVLTIIAGGSVIAAFAPISFWYMVFPGLIWLFLPLRQLTLKETLLRGLWFNIGFFGVGISWVHVSIHRFGNVPLPISIPLTFSFILLLSLYATISLFLLKRYFSHLSNNLYYLVALPFAWISVEWLGSWLATGFPWLNLGHSQIDGYLSSIAPLLGSAGISYVIMLIVGLVVLVLKDGKKSLKLALPIAVLIIVAVSSLHQVQWVSKTDERLTVSLIQPSIAQDKKWLLEERRKTLRYFKETTEQLDSQLVIWPEGAIPALESQVSNYLQLVSSNAKSKSQAILTGLAVRDDNKYYNTTIMLGTGQGRYYKQHLVPFGEYVPFESWLRGMIGVFDLPMSSFSSGSDDQPLLRVEDWKIAMAICFEIIFQDIVANQLVNSDVLITLSNDAWFADSLGAYQHLDIARIRALENGIPVIRATNDGISAMIDHQGNILGKMAKFEKGVLSGSITKINGETPYRKLGPILCYLILLVIPGLVLLSSELFRRSKGHKL